MLCRKVERTAEQIDGTGDLLAEGISEALHVGVLGDIDELLKERFERRQCCTENRETNPLEDHLQPLEVVMGPRCPLSSRGTEDQAELMRFCIYLFLLRAILVEHGNQLRAGLAEERHGQRRLSARSPHGRELRRHL